MTFQLSAEQTAIIEAARDTTDSLLISALAGAAKTTTLLHIMEALPKTSGICLSFNKRIADEMRSKCPENFKSQTLNALGHQAWGDRIGRRPKIDMRKNYEAMKDFIEALPHKEQEEAWESSSFVLRSVSHAKSAGHVPDSIAKREKDAKPLQTDMEMFSSLEEEPTPLEGKMLLHILTASMELAFSGVIDFDDQILMPTCFRAAFPRYPLVLVDEAQDLSALNHSMLAKLVRKRLIAVGDQCQAIYGFRGAHSSGMAEMKERFNLHELFLSCSFRCPQAVVSHVQWRAPTMTAWDGNPTPGEVTFLPAWSISDVPDGAAILCRNNAPLLRIALLCFRNGRYPNLWGNDIAKGLMAVFKKIGPKNMPRQSALHQLAEWYAKQEKRARNKGALKDKRDCVALFIEETNTLGEAIERCQAILNCEGHINLLTIHKAKGHEWKNVLILDHELISDRGQDPNVRYVGATRAMDTLRYIDTETCAELIAEAD